jgi:predicted aspartyl protease
MREIREKIRLWNFLEEEKVRKGEIIPMEYEGIVDSGAIQMAIPERIVRQLKLVKSKRKVPVEYANGDIEEKEIAEGIKIELRGRETVTTAIIEPNGKEILIGMLILEALDLWIDTKEGKLIPNPESPDRPLYKLRKIKERRRLK